MSELPPNPADEGAPDRRGKPADAVLAAELALGVLDAAARARAEARAATDDAFAADAADWMARLHPLIAEVHPVAPSAALWTRVAAGAGIDPQTGLAASAEAPPALSASASAPVPSAPAPSAPAPSAPTAEVIPLRRPKAVGAWRAAAFGGFALAAASLVVAVVVSTRPISAASPLLAAKLSPVGGAPSILTSEPLFVATLDRSRGAVVMTPISPGPVDPRVRELWLIPKGGKPIAAGLLDVNHTRPMRLKPELLKLAEAGATLAISLEPAGGSPTDSPTGPVIAAGVLDRI